MSPIRRVPSTLFNVGLAVVWSAAAAACADAVNSGGEPAGDASGLGGDSDAGGGDVANAPGDEATAAGDTANAPGDQATAPGDQATAPGDQAVLGGDATGPAGDSTPGSCGDGTCAATETCVTCPDDCGACDLPTLTATPPSISSGESSTLTLTTPATDYHNIFINGVRPTCTCTTVCTCTMIVTPTETTTYQASATNAAGTAYVMPSIVVTVIPTDCGNGACDSGETCSSCSTDCGQCAVTWGPPSQITSGGYQAIAATGDTVHVVWGQGSVSYRRSTDGGLNWSSPIGMGSGTPDLDDPLAVDGDNVYVVYVDNVRDLTDWRGPRPCGDLYLRISRDAGVNWSAPVQLTTSRAIFRLSLAVAAGRLHLVWMDFRSGVWDIYYLRSLDAGVTWQPEVQLVPGTPILGAERPQVASIGDDVHVVWMDGRDDNPTCNIETQFPLPQCTEIYYRRSRDGGATWDPDAPLTTMSAGSVYSGRPDVAVVGASTVLVVYDHTFDIANINGNEQFLLRSTDAGTGWGAATRLTNATGDSSHGYLAVDGAETHLVWFDTRVPNGGIYYLHSPDSGATWDAEERVADGSAAPLAAAANGTVHVLWDNGWYRWRR